MICVASKINWVAKKPSRPIVLTVWFFFVSIQGSCSHVYIVDAFRVSTLFLKFIRVKFDENVSDISMYYNIQTNNNNLLYNRVS